MIFAAQIKSHLDDGVATLTSLKNNNKTLAEHKNSPLWPEFIKIAQNKNPAVDTSLDYVFVLSARGTYLKNWADNQNIPDKSDDFNRMRLGVEIAREVTAKRLAKPISELTQEDMILFGPTIIYNGLGIHNQELVKAFASSVLTDYPIQKFEILDLPKEHGNTKGQFLCLKDRIKTGKLKINNTTVAVITHAYHYPRISRMLGASAPLNPFSPKTKCLAMLVDRTFSTPGIDEDIARELKNIPIYTAKKDLAEKPSDTVIDCAVMAPVVAVNSAAATSAADVINVKKTKEIEAVDAKKTVIEPNFIAAQTLIHAYSQKSKVVGKASLDEIDELRMLNMQKLKSRLL